MRDLLETSRIARGVAQALGTQSRLWGYALVAAGASVSAQAQNAPAPAGEDEIERRGQPQRAAGARYRCNLHRSVEGQTLHYSASWKSATTDRSQSPRDARQAARLAPVEVLPPRRRRSVKLPNG